MLGHIPGSVPLHWRQLNENPNKPRSGHLSDDVSRLQRLLRNVGVCQRKPVLLVDKGRDGFGEAGRLYWTLDYLSHPALYILDGGIKQWPGTLRRAMRVPAVVPGDFVPVPRESRRARRLEVEAAVGAKDVVIWDIRTPEEFLGATPYFEARGGHIPGAVGLDYRNLLDVDGRCKPVAAVQAVLDRLGIDPQQRIILVCSGGVRSAAAYAVLRSAGCRNVANYDGSMWEWAGLPALPMDTGAQRPQLSTADSGAHTLNEE